MRGKRSIYLWTLIVLGFIPRVHIKPKIGQNLHSHPLGTHPITSSAPCLAEIVGSLPGAVFILSYQWVILRGCSPRRWDGRAGGGVRSQKLFCFFLKINFAACKRWLFCMIQNKWVDQVVTPVLVAPPTHQLVEYEIPEIPCASLLSCCFLTGVKYKHSDSEYVRSLGQVNS